MFPAGNVQNASMVRKARINEKGNGPKMIFAFVVNSFNANSSF
jgi:hypothetical protein